jgi:4-amino-4-deoxy-L-arabinose transferase-like glycosyltransferase
MESQAGGAPPGRAAGGHLLAAALALTVLGSAWGLGGYALVEPDEGRNAEAAREVAAGGDWLLPSFNGLPYLDKPLLWFDATALAMKAAGAGELAARLPSLLFTLATVGLMIAFGRRELGPEAGWLAGLATAASPLTVAFARIAIFDAMLSFFVVAAILTFYTAVERWRPAGDPGGPGSGARWALGGWLALAAAALTKGPVGVVLPLLVVVPYAVWRRRLRALGSLPGAALFLALTLPWVAYVAHRIPGYLRYVVVTESLGRLTTTELNRAGPWWYFFPYVAAGALPWSVAALAAGWRRPRPGGGPPRGIVVLALLWLVVPFVFFSLSQSKRPQYVVPLMPAIALLLAASWRDFRALRRARLWGAASLAALGAVLVAAAIRLLPVSRHLDAGLEAAATQGALAVGVACLVAAAIGFLVARPALALAAFALPLAALPAATLPLARAVAEARSSRSLAAAITTACPGAPVVGVAALPKSLPFYLGRPVVLASDSGTEVASTFVGMHWQSLVASRSAARPAGWWRTALAEPGPHVFVAASRDQAGRLALEQAGAAQVFDDGRYAAFTACPGS